MLAWSPLGGVAWTAVASCARWQVPHVMAGWRYGALRAGLTAGVTAHRVCLEMDRVGTFVSASYHPAPARLPSPRSCNHSILRVTAPRSNWAVTLVALAGRGLAFVGLPWRLGHLMKTSTLWLMTSLSPSDILQMDNLLYHSHARTTIHKHKTGVHLDVVKPHWTLAGFPLTFLFFWIQKRHVNIWLFWYHPFSSSLQH